MKKIFIFLLLLTATAVIPGSSAHAFSPEKPKPIINNNTELCAPFLKAWEDVFEQDGSIDESQLDLEKYFDSSTLLQFPKTRPPGLYGKGYFFKADIDADRKVETFYIKSNEVGWRYLGVDLYKVENIEDLEKKFSIHLENELPRELQNEISPTNREISPELNKFFKKIYNYKPAEYVHFIRRNDGLYTFSIPRSPTDTTSSSVELVRLGEAEASTICKADLLPPKSKYLEFTENSDAFKMLKNVYGGAQGCMGTMGWTAKPLDYSLSNIFERPHILLRERENSWQDSDAARKLRYISWAISDPISWQKFRAFESANISFIKYMENYYTSNFDFNGEKSKKLAELAWKYWLDEVIYARNPDGYQITFAAKFLNGPVSVETTDLVHEAYEILTKHDLGRFASENIYTDLLLALIYTSSDKEKILSIYEKVKSRRDDIDRLNQTILNNTLLASIGNTELMQISLGYGADINAETNWFKKTPLMYAVQMNDIESTKFLIDHGASINKSTDGSNYKCDRLERDHRTPLMYAAENGNEDIINLLLDSGADISATDNKGNTAHWYLEQNSLIINKDNIRDLLKH